MSHNEQARWLALPMTRNERRQVFGAEADQVRDADVLEDAIHGPLVDRCGADAELRRDLAHGEEALDRR